MSTMLDRPAEIYTSMATENFQKPFGRHFATSLINDFAKSSEDQYYLFIGNVDEWPNESVAPGVTGSLDAQNDAFRTSIAAKRIDKNNAIHIVPRTNWVSGTTFDVYDDTLSLFDLPSSGVVGNNFYALVDESKIYKVIDNNNGGASTVKPEFTGTDVTLVGDDGYKWKFLGKVTEDIRPFMTDDYMPVRIVTDITNTNSIHQYEAQQKAVPGSIEYFKRDIEGSAVYSAGFSEGTRRSCQHGNTGDLNRVYLDRDSSPNEISSYYSGYAIYIVDGRGPEVGQYRRISNYVYQDGDNNAKFNSDPYVVVDQPFDFELYPDETLGNLDSEKKPSSYIIIPHAVVTGNGSECTVRTKLNTSNRVSDIVPITQGKDYSTALVDILTIPTSGTADSWRPIISPKKGHAGHIVEDLEASRTMINIKISRDENESISTKNDFRQFGIIKNPLLNDGTERIAGSELAQLTQLVLRKPVFINGNYDYTFGSGTFLDGKYIMGVESKATAKIQSFHSRNSEYVDILVEDPNGVFKTQDLNNNTKRIVFGVTSDNVDEFDLGERVTQYTGIGTGTAEGTVVDWDNVRQELLVDPIIGSFSGSTLAAEVRGTSSDAFYPNISRVEAKGGELIKTFVQGTTTDTISFQTISGEQDIARIVSVDDKTSTTVLNKLYRTTTNVIVQGRADATSATGFKLTENAFSSDDVVVQGAKETSNYAQGSVVEWKYESGATGELILTNVIGTFRGGEGTDSFGLSGGTPNAPSNKWITSVSEPELKLSSGDVLYIENIKQIDRNIEQAEDFKIILGF